MKHLYLLVCLILSTNTLESETETGLFRADRLSGHIQFLAATKFSASDFAAMFWHCFRNRFFDHWQLRR